MLPPGLHMLPLLWLLLWTPELGLSSLLSPEDMMTGLVPEDMSTLYNKATGVGEKTIAEESVGAGKESTEEELEREDEYYPTKVQKVLMLGRNNAIYKQFKKSRHSLYIIFNATEIREAVPDPSLLAQAELQLYSVKQQEEQIVMVFEKYSRKSWRFVKYWVLVPSNTAEWLSLDVTGAVCQWLNHRGEFEVFRLTAQMSVFNNDNVLHMEISGINSIGHDDILDNEGVSSYQPFLRLVTFPPEKPKQVDSSRYS